MRLSALLLLGVIHFAHPGRHARAPRVASPISGPQTLRRRREQTMSTKFERASCHPRVLPGNGAHGDF